MLGCILKINIRRVVVCPVQGVPKNKTIEINALFELERKNASKAIKKLKYPYIIYIQLCTSTLIPLGLGFTGIGAPFV
jgi:hypothetical protein